MILSSDGFLSAAERPDGAYAAWQLAAAFPNHPIAAINMPAHGYSDPYTHEQKSQMFRNKRMTLVGEATLQGLRSRGEFADSKDLLTYGRSTGGLITLEIANLAHSQPDEYGTHVPGMFLAESGGMHQQPEFKLAWNFFVRDPIRQRRYQDEEFHHLNQSFDDFTSALNRRYPDASYPGMLAPIKKDPGILPLIFLRNPLANENAYKITDEIVAKDNPPEMTYVTGDDSLVTYPKGEPNHYGLINKYPNVSYVSLLWDTHGLGLAPNAPRLTAIARDAWTQQIPDFVA